MMKNLLLLAAFMAFSFLAAAQATGDYRSVTGTEMEWQDITTWQTYDGSDWVDAVDFPANGGATIDYSITIPSGSDVICSLISPININIGATGQIVVQSGGILTILSTGAPVELNIAAGAVVTVDGDLNCLEDIINAGSLTVNGTLTNELP